MVRSDCEQVVANRLRRRLQNAGKTSLLRVLAVSDFPIGDEADGPCHPSLAMASTIRHPKASSSHFMLRSC